MSDFESTPSPTDDFPAPEPSSVEPTSEPPTSSSTFEPPSSSTEPTQPPPSSSSTSTPPPTTSEPPTTEPPPPSSSSSQQPPTTDPTSSSTSPSVSPSPSDIPSSQPPPSSSSASPTPPPPSSSSTSLVPVPSSSSSLIVAPSSQPNVFSTTSPPPAIVSQPPTGLYVTTDSVGSTYTGSLSLVLSTDANGRTMTVTVVSKGNPSLDGGSASRHGGSNFFDNTGAVAGVFVVVGLVVTSCLGLFTWWMLRRRRRQRLDRDVAAAAAAAAAAHHPRFEDDDEPAMVQYNNFYPTSSGDIEGQQPQDTHTRGYDYEDPAGGYDPYAANLVDVPFQDGNERMSTATAPGFAGFGAGQAYYENQHNVDFSQSGGGGGGGGDYHQSSDYKHSYGDPQYDVAHNYAGPDEPFVNNAQGHGMGMGMGHDQTGYTYPPYQSVPHQDAPYSPPGVPRPDSVGSVLSGTNVNNRDLTVTNV